MYGMGDDSPTRGQQLVLDYRAGAKTMGEVQNVCRAVRPVDRLHTDYDECRWFLPPEELCRIENNNRDCTNEQLGQQCFMTPANLRHNRCFLYMNNMTTEEAQASNAGPEVDSSLQQASGTIAQYRDRVAEAAKNIVRTLRPVDPQVQALQQTMISSGCSLPRYGADGRWGTETESGLQCLAGRQGWPSVLQQYPWVAQRVTVPTQAVASAKPSGGASTVGITQVPTSTTQTASILPSLVIPGLPAWATWVAAGLGLVSIIALGAYLTRGR